MKYNTLVCAYGKNEPVERIFERLYAMYLTNYREDYAYFALIDLPDGDYYRISGDMEIEDRVRHCYAMLERVHANRFFCAVRQRRIGYDERRFSCERGVAGAIETLWRFIKGGKNEVYPSFGEADFSEVDKVYFTAGGGDEISRISIIEPGGIFKLCSRIGENEAIIIGKACKDGHSFVGEGLYSAAALDKMLFFEPPRLDYLVANDVEPYFFDTAYLEKGQKIL